MRQTLLEIVQGLLDAMDSDEVNSISDTTESLQVARLCRGVFYDCATDLGLQEHEAVFELNPSADINKPVLMTIPNNVSKVLWIKYNHKLSTETVSKYVEIAKENFLDFFTKQQNYDTEAYPNQDEMTYVSNTENFELKYLTDTMPTRYTSLSNNTLLFNSIDLTEDTTLQKSKTMCGGLVYPSFDLLDDFYPTLDPAQFSYYVNKCKVRAFYELKQVENREAGGEARKQKIAIQTNKFRLPEDSALTRQKRLTGYGK